MSDAQLREDGPAAARPVVRPPILLVAAILAGLAMDHLVPLPFRLPRDDSILHRSIPAVVIFIGLAIAVAGIRSFVRMGTPVPGNRPTLTLVTTGIHALSRNPIYVGMLVLYVGIGIALRSSWTVVLAPVVAAVIRYAVVAREEAYLEQRFGDEYRAYRSKVRRWL
jgi:protein-S-isoprenylcysteine O-methyltransferase Ste14